MKKGVKFLIVLLLLIIIGLVSYIAVDKLVLSKDEESEEKSNVVAENKVDKKEETKKEDSENTSVEKNKSTKTYADIQGTYESDGINVNEGSGLEPYYMSHVLVLSKEGTFALYYTDTSCHNVGYYTIVDNKLTLYSVVATGNDPSAGLSNEKFEFTLNSDGTINGKDNVKLKRKSETPREDTNIANLINKYMAGCTTSGKDGQGPWFTGLE